MIPKGRASATKPAHERLYEPKEMAQRDRLAIQVALEEDTLSAIPAEKEEQARVQRDEFGQPKGGGMRP